MAKQKINKSAAIRAYLGKNPSATPKAIIEDLKKKGVVVGASLVSQVKYNQAKPNKASKKPGRRASVNGHQVGIENLVEAKALADRLGGVDKARQALDMLAKIMA